MVIALRLGVVFALELGLRHFRREDHIGRILNVRGRPGAELGHGHRVRQDGRAGARRTAVERHNHGLPEAQPLAETLAAGQGQRECQKGENLQTPHKIPFKKSGLP